MRFALLLVAGLSGGPLCAQTVADAAAPESDERKDYAQISLQELLDRDISVAATKTRVDVAKAPASVTVLTSEDIRRAGGRRLADVLRAVPGLDVLESFPGQVSVSARGTSEVFVNNMLVLIDGRRLEFQAAGVPFFENAPLRLEDIKRIEVVKGPVGALYGTNALAGIISITTFAPDEVPGTLVSLGAGTRDTYGATLRQAGRIGEDGWAYKLVGGYSYAGTWSSLGAGDTRPPVGLRKGDLLGVVQRRLGEDARLELEAAVTKGDLASLSVVTNQTRYFTWPHLRLSYGRPDFHAQLSYSPQSSELLDFGGPTRLTDHARALAFTTDRTFTPFAGAKLTVGGDVRYQRSTFTNIAVPHSQVVWAAFVQDEQTLLADRLILFGAVGLSEHPETPLQVDGNVALVLTPRAGHSVRLSAGRGHRDPSFNESYFDNRRRFGTRDGYQASNLDLRPESLRALELGYHARLDLGRSRLRLFAEGFAEEVRDLINTVNTIVPPGTVARYPTVTLIQQFRNLEGRDGRGFEAGAEWTGSSVSLLGQYAHQRFEDGATGREVRSDVPRHKASGAFRWQNARVEVDLWGHSVSATAASPRYFLLNPRLAVRLAGWTVSAEAFNALNDRHSQTVNGQNVRGETVGRALSVQLTRMLGPRP